MTERGDLSGVPESIPVFRGDTAGKIYFPSSDISIRLQKTDIDATALKKTPYALFIPLLSEGLDFPVGVIGEIRVGSTINDTIFCYFRGIARVRYILETTGDPQIPNARWSIFPEETLKKEETETEDFQKQLELFALVITTFIQRYRGFQPEITRRVLQFAFARDMIVQSCLISGDNLPALLDMVMNTAITLGTPYMRNNVALAEEKKLYLRDVALVTLQLSEISQRMTYVKAFLELLLLIAEKGNTKSLLGPPKNLHPPESKPPSTTSNNITQKQETDKRSLAREELKKPRILTPRFASLNPLPPITGYETLDTETPSEFEKNLTSFLNEYIVDQERCKKHFGQILTPLLTNINASSDKPIVGGILCGPTGVGKTESVRALANYFFNDPEGYLHISGETLDQEHTAAKLLGSPAGYLGYGDMPALSQWELDKAHFLKLLRERHAHEPEILAVILQEVQTLSSAMGRGGRTNTDERISAKNRLCELGWQPGRHLSMLLFDEIEKAHPSVLRLLIRVFDNGTLQLMNNEVTVFTNTILWFTSNLYGREIQRLISRRGLIGFSGASQTTEETLSQDIWKGTIAAIEKFLLPELFGRIGKENVIVFHPLRREDLITILERTELPALVDTIRKEHGIEVFVSEETKYFLVHEVTDRINSTLGARSLSAVIRNKIQNRLGRLIERQNPPGVKRGDRILIDIDQGKIIFKKIIS